jgi:integrase
MAVANVERDVPRGRWLSTRPSGATALRGADHYVFPWHGRNKKIDPARGMTSWRTAWRNMRKASGLTHVRFHDGRHTAITTLAEKGLADWVIQAQVGHVAPEMMKTYSHIRRQALNEAAAALEPSKPTVPVSPSRRPVARRHERRVMSQSTSQSRAARGRLLDFPGVLPET